MDCQFFPFSRESIRGRLPMPRHKSQKITRCRTILPADRRTNRRFLPQLPTTLDRQTRRSHNTHQRNPRRTPLRPLQATEKPSNSPKPSDTRSLIRSPNPKNLSPKSYNTPIALSACEAIPASEKTTKTKHTHSTQDPS